MNKPIIAKPFLGCGSFFMKQIFLKPRLKFSLYKDFFKFVLVIYFVIFVLQPVYSDSLDVFEASKSGDIKSVLSFIEKDVDVVNVRDSSNLTPLHYASLYGHTEIVKILIENNADIDAKDTYDQTPLHAASWDCQTETAEVLLKYNANVHIDPTLLHYTSKRGCTKIAELFILKSVDIDIPNELNQTALHYAIIYRQTETAEMLLKKDANVDAKDHSGATSLHYASGYGQTENVELLIRYKANVHAKDNNDMTPLYYAVMNDQIGTADILLKNKAKVNSKDKFDQTPLDIAGSPELENLLKSYQ